MTNAMPARTIPTTQLHINSSIAPSSVTITTFHHQPPAAPHLPPPTNAVNTPRISPRSGHPATPAGVAAQFWQYYDKYRPYGRDFSEIVSRSAGRKQEPYLAGSALRAAAGTVVALPAGFWCQNGQVYITCLIRHSPETPLWHARTAAQPSQTTKQEPYLHFFCPRTAPAGVPARWMFVTRFRLRSAVFPSAAVRPAVWRLRRCLQAS